MKPENDRCEEHGMYLYRTGFGWSCKLGCYYSDDPEQLKNKIIKCYKEELKEKILDKIELIFSEYNDSKVNSFKIDINKEILKLLEETK